MRLVARHRIEVSPPLRETLSRLGEPALAGSRLCLALAATVTGLLMGIGQIRGADTHWLVVPAAFLLLAQPACALAHRVLPRHYPRLSASPGHARAGENHLSIPGVEGRAGGPVDCTRCPAAGDPSTSPAGGAPAPMENPRPCRPQRDLLAKLRQLKIHRTDYVATVSHELRTPLTSIKGFAQLMLKSEELPASLARGYAATVAAEADKLAHIVNDLLDLMRMETGLLELRREPTCPADLINGVAHALRPSEGSPWLEIDLPDHLPPVRGDLERLDQVLRWLIADALDRSSPDSMLRLSAEAGEEGVTIRLEYRASGDRIEGLIQALERPGQIGIEGQATRLGQGGLGLYISKNFIEAHGGRMRVESLEGHRTRVGFTLPY